MKGYSFEVAAEVVVPKATSRLSLVVFLDLTHCPWTAPQKHLNEISRALSDQLPSYAIPSAYVPVKTLPLNASGKLDRKALKRLGEELRLDQLMGNAGGTDVVPPTTELETHLQRLWADVLSLPLHVIGTTSNFFKVTGDSISAMQLASLVQAEGYTLTVSDILSHPRLADMAKMMRKAQAGLTSKEFNEPFSLLNNPGAIDQVLAEVSFLCHVAVADIEDVYPCTALQSSLIAASSRRCGGYVAHLWLELVDNVDLQRLRQSWDEVSRKIAPILRNRVIALPGEEFVQAQLAEQLPWTQYSTQELFQHAVQDQSTDLGSPMARLAVVGDTSNKKCYCVLSQHHAVYDGSSIRLLLNEVGHCYAGHGPTKRVAPFQDFIRYKLSRNKEKEKAFWARQFSNCEAVLFPALPNDTVQVQADSTVARNIADISWPDAEVTKSTIIRAVWSILSSKHTDSLDTVFGILSTGRQAPVANIENMIAPTIAALPLRVKLEPNVTVKELLLQLHQQAIDMIPHEQSELSDILRASEDAALGSHFNSLLVIQHHGQDIDFVIPGGPFASADLRQPREKDARDEGLNDFNPHAVMIMCQLRKNGDLTIELNFDSRVLDALQAELLLGHFEQILRNLAPSMNQKVMDISPTSEKDLQLIWGWNSSMPAAKHTCVHDLIAETTASRLSHEAICAWDGSFTYRELRDLSDRLAHHLVALGAGRGSVVPLFFEKSRWMSVAALAVMKAGAGCLSLDVTQPPGRLRTIIAEVAPMMSLASSGIEQIARSVSGADVVVVNDKLRIERSIDNSMTMRLPKVDPTDVLYLVATSGSTGIPKLIVTLHENFASAAVHQSEALCVRPGMRVFDFVSYSFDVAWSNLLNTLISGACLCVPSEAQRKDNIAAAFNHLHADYAYFTPSVARSLEPFSMPGLRILAMGGEAISAAEVARWRHLDAVIGIYGPAECAQALCIARLGKGERSNFVGRSFGARTWLVKPGDPEVLAPIGAVGELMIEGPTVAHGYWRNQRLTDAVFSKDAPAWLSRGVTEHPGRSARLCITGDLLRYASDGSLSFVGRKDQLVKLRGQRVELNEVEHHVQKRLADYPTLCSAVAAEIIQPSNSKAPILVVFIGIVRKEGHHGQSDHLSRLSRIIDDLEDDLREVLPPYMLPSGYFPLDELPVTTTNKINRRALKELGARLTLEDLGKLHLRGTSRQAPTTDVERSLQRLWSTILGIEIASIKSQSSFLRIGGESISAMRLVAAAREVGLSFSVADVFRNPRLCDLARVVKQVESKQAPPAFEPRKPFSLLTTAHGSVMEYMQDVVEPLLVDIEAEDIQDVLPATDFQEIAVLEALQNPPGRLPHWILDLPKDVDFARLRWACKRLLEHFDVLRSVFVKLENGKIWQVQASHLKPLFQMVNVNDAENEKLEAAVHAACEADLQRPRRLGQSFVRFIVVKSSVEGTHKLVFRLSHAQFDGFSFGALLDGLSALYSGERPPVVGASFGDYIAYIHQRKARSLEHWRRRLQDCSVPDWSGATSLEALDASTHDRLSIVMHADFASRGLRGLPAATIFHTACAIVLSREFDQDDVVFGRLVTGRSMLRSSLQGVVGPTLVEVPIRYLRPTKGSSEHDIWTVAREFHTQFIDDASYEGAGMREIISQATSWPAHEVDNFGWRTAFQQEETEHFSFLGQEKAKVTVFERDHLPRQRPEIYATPSNGRLELRFEGSKKITSEAVAQRVLRRLIETLEG
jgi:amino acid adenylation domain-containing protein